MSTNRSRSGKKFWTDWKTISVIAVLIWSVVNLFEIKPNAEYKEMLRMADLSGTALHAEVIEKVKKLPGWEKYNEYQKEDAIKREYDDAARGNNVQPIATIRGYKLFTNLKLGLDLRGGSQLLLQALPAPPVVPEITPQVMEGVQNIINNRINSLGVSETIIQRAGRDRLIVEMPGIKDPQQAKDRIGTTALLEFKELGFSSEGIPLWKDTGLTGKDFKRAAATRIGGSNSWQVEFEFKPEGAKNLAISPSVSPANTLGSFSTVSLPTVVPMASQYRSSIIQACASTSRSLAGAVRSPAALLRIRPSI